MRVIGAGFGRTGTLSLKAALEALGLGPCYHMVSVFEHPDHIALWQGAAEGNPIDWGALFTGFASVVDWPATAFYETLMARYPEAKVILTERDPDKWYESVINTVHRVTMEPAPPEALAHRRMVDTIVWTGTFGGRFTDKAHAIDVYRRHNAEVRRRVPADRLLVFEVKNGWEPLCRFLDVPAPSDEPFPHLNDTHSFLQRVASRDR
jgi:hypothetical protein